MAQTESATQDHIEGHYAALNERAITFLERQGGSAHEDALIAFVFGRSAAPALWRTLLQTALAGEPRLTYALDGRWLLVRDATRNVESTDSLLPRFVAVDVETTGLKPSRQRIIEVAAVRYEHGAETARFDRLVNPGTRIPEYISKLTGIRDDDVVNEPGFAALASEIFAFIADDLIVGHNVGFDIGFLNAELQRARTARLVNDSIDTLALATRLLPGVRRPSLDRIAKVVGVAPRNNHRAGVDADITAEVALKLEVEARRQGVGTLDGLKHLASVRKRAPREHVGRGRSLIDRSLLDNIPRRPGVYIMRDSEGRVLYVGKAKNLRERVGTYYSQPLGYARKMDGLLESVHRIETETAGSELEALLLESQLIRRYFPRYNTMMRAYEHYPFIKVSVGNRWPRVTLVKDRVDDGARYFGPYRSRTVAKRTVEAINDILPLRTCTRSFKDARSYGRPCMRLSLGKCLGPCVDLTIADDYRDAVDQVLRFLDGDDDALYGHIWQELEHAAERQDFERAEKLRRSLGSLNGVVAGQRELRLAIGGDHLLLAVPAATDGNRELWLVLDGRVWSRLRIGQRSSRERAEESDSARLMCSYDRYRDAGLPPISRDGLDDAHILNRWIAENPDHPAIQVVDRERTGDPDYWQAMCEQAITVPGSELALSAGRPSSTGPGEANTNGGELDSAWTTMRPSADCYH